MNFTMTSSASALSFDKELKLHTLQHEGRNIAYSMSSRISESKHPVLFFYPVGSGRRTLLAFRSLFSEISFLCVNRPGKGGTSPSVETESHLDTVIKDIIAVLDSLQMEKVSILAECAGTPFAMAFCTWFPERTTRIYIGIASWIQPADCGYEHTKLVYHMGTQSSSLTGPFAATFMSSMGYLVASFPVSWFASMLKSKLSQEECIEFDTLYSNADDFSNMIAWMKQDSRGGMSPDLQVLLSKDVVDYQALAKSQDTIILWHGTNDSMVPIGGAEWLAEQLPNAELHTIPDGTHEGCMLFLHPAIVDSLKSNFG